MKYLHENVDHQIIRSDHQIGGIYSASKIMVFSIKKGALNLGLLPTRSYSNIGNL